MSKRKKDEELRVQSKTSKTHPASTRSTTGNPRKGTDRTERFPKVSCNNPHSHHLRRTPSPQRCLMPIVKSETGNTTHGRTLKVLPFNEEVRTQGVRAEITAMHRAMNPFLFFLPFDRHYATCARQVFFTFIMFRGPFIPVFYPPLYGLSAGISVATIYQ